MSEELYNIESNLFDDEQLSYLEQLFAEEDDATDEAGDVCPTDTPKLDADYAGYMELTGAKKDGDCKIVQVEGGISKELGCCNLFHPDGEPDKFSCGTCKYLG